MEIRVFSENLMGVGAHVAWGHMEDSQVVFRIDSFDLAEIATAQWTS